MRKTEFNREAFLHYIRDKREDLNKIIILVHRMRTHFRCYLFS